MASICFFSSSVRYFSVSFLSHSIGMSAASASLDQVEALEHVAEDAVELVEIALVLHQRRARQIVEILDPAVGEIRLHRLHQREVFAQRHRQAGLLELMEEGREHSGTHFAARRRRGSAKSPTRPKARPMAPIPHDGPPYPTTQPKQKIYLVLYL